MYLIIFDYINGFLYKNSGLTLLQLGLLQQIVEKKILVINVSIYFWSTYVKSLYYIREKSLLH